MKHDALAMLTPDDWALLARHMRRVAYPRGARLLTEGARERALWVVRSGAVRVERLLQGRTIVLRELGPGELLGEIGFVEDAPASASVVAQDDCTADVIDGDVLQSLVAAEPGFAVRFYHSLAVALARRTRSGDAARAAAGPPQRAARTGNLSARQVPPELEAGLEAFEREMLAARSALRRGAPPAGEAARAAAACDAVVALMDVHAGGDALVDIGWSDLLAFRDPGTIEAGIGDAVFRETFATFMESATMARCHAKPRGFADDHETVALMLRDEPEGDGWTGPLIDRWFLGRPLARSRREGVARVQALLREAAAAHGPGLRVASLASGTAAGLFAFFEQARDAAVTALCVDRDEEALLATARRAEAAGLGERMAFVLGDVLPRDGEALPLQRQHVVLALGLAEALDDEALVALLDRCHALLLPGGRLLLSALADGNPDRRLMAHLLDWPARHRSADELRALFARSAFAGRAPALVLDAAGVTLYADCTRA